MPNWTDLISGSEELQVAYEPHRPSIHEITLRTLTLLRARPGSSRFPREGGTPAADITFDLIDPPRQLPQSWTKGEKRAAVFTVTLRLLGVSELSTEGRMSVDTITRATLAGADTGIYSPPEQRIFRVLGESDLGRGSRVQRESDLELT